MFRPTAATAGAALTLTMLLTTACNQGYPGGSTEMQNLSAEAIGVVTVGPSTLPFSTDTDRTLVFTFDKQGAALGRIEGGAIYTARATSWNRGFAAATADSVITVTQGGRTSTAIDENMVEGTAHDQRTGRTMFWFNTAQPDGPDIPYRNNYVMTGPGQTFHSDSVPGMMHSAGHCGNRAYGVVAAFDAVAARSPTLAHQLYEMPIDGAPVKLSEWNFPEGFRAVSRTEACTADGNTLYNLYGSVEARRVPTTGSGLVLVRTDTTTGTHTETPIDMAGHPAATRADTFTLLDNTLYWIAQDGAVLSLPLDGPHKARKLWTLPAEGDGHEVTVTGTTVAHIDYRDTPTYTEYDLLTGHRTRDPVELPWLKPIVNSRTESGKTTYTVTGVTNLARPGK